MKTISVKLLAKLAEERGWTLARVNGSHHVYAQEGRIEVGPCSSMFIL
jgi:predicted RNA binding protein YcfA (HicA-like mRNA interferase family)